MKEARLTQLEQGLNGIAKKVLDAVPIKEPWSKERIQQEIRRSGNSAQRDIVEACLDNLRGRGLIKEPQHGIFIRVQAKEKNTSSIDTKPVPMLAKPVHQKEIELPIENDKPDALSRIAAIAKNLTTQIQELEAVALDVADHIQKVEKDSEKLRQLQALLKGLGS